MADQSARAFLPTACQGPAWDGARAQLKHPYASDPSLERVAAELGIRDVLPRYSYAVDQGDLDAAMQFFTDDCVINSPKGAVEGSTAIRTYLEKTFQATPNRFHLFTNIAVRVADDHRSGLITSSYFAILQAADQPPNAVGGLIADQVVLQDNVWKIRERSIARDLACALTALSSG